MLAKRIIAALDIKEGRTVKGVNFEGLRDAGDPVDLAVQYSKNGIDEVVLLDITATHEGRGIFLDVVRNVAEKLTIPFTAGGGVKSIDDVRALLAAGADKVFVNSAAVNNPSLIRELADEFGSQCIVVAIDVRLKDGAWKVFVRGGREETTLEAFTWAQEVVRLGAGELLVTSMDHDGVEKGFPVEFFSALTSQVTVPVIASGGAGTTEHFIEVFRQGRVDAALAASIFHFGEIPVAELKDVLRKVEISVR